MNKVLMKCGHNGHATSDGNPCCVICWPDPASMIVDDSPPDFSGREAICAQCKSENSLRNSSPNLAFFKYKGPDSPFSTEMCTCGFHKNAHPIDNSWTSRKCDHFVATGPARYDEYYCGCRGWN